VLRKKKVNILLLVLMIFVAGCFNLSVEAAAPTSEEYMSESTIQPRGYYLAEGTSGITKVSTYKLNAMGDTTAARRCEVSVSVVVEKYLEDRGWVYYTSWQTTNTNAFSASISKTIYVDLGYFYRVVSTHTAGTDTSSSFTNAIWMGL